MKILAIDYGKNKVGLALGDNKTMLVEPLKVISRVQLESRIVKLVEDYQVEKLLIGLTGGEIDKEIKLFAKKLEKKTGLAAEFADETLSTWEAKKLLLSVGRKRKYRQEMEDAIAASIMLKYHLENSHC